MRRVCFQHRYPDGDGIDNYLIPDDKIDDYLATRDQDRTWTDTARKGSCSHTANTWLCGWGPPRYAAQGGSGLPPRGPRRSASTLHEGETTLEGGLSADPRAVLFQAPSGSIVASDALVAAVRPKG